MLQLQAYYLEPRSAFHLGERGIGIEASDVMAHADTVFSALCMICRQWAGNQQLTDMLSSFLSDPPFLLSSAFPYVTRQNGERLRLFPRPLNLPPGLEELAKRKAVKGVRFVSESLFRLWIAGESLRAYLPSEEEAGEDFHLLQKGRVWVSPEEYTDLSTTQIWGGDEEPVPRVTVDRLSSASAVYQAGRIRFAPGCGLWVAFQYRAEGWQEFVEDLLLVLGDDGLGGERSAGHGQYTLNLEQSEVLQLPDPAARSVILSLYWPPSQEEANAALKGEGIYYELLMRRGWLTSPEGPTYRRKSVRMLAEGSVIGATGRETPGWLADVTPGAFPDHPVYRYGYALTVGSM